MEMMGKFTIPDDVAKCIDWIVSRDNLDYADNYRAFRIKDLRGYAEYLEAYKRGCCGFMDTVVFDRYGYTWVIGCNYGH